MEVKDIAMMNDPNRWFRWPFLPLKRDAPPGATASVFCGLQLGVMLEDFTVLLCSMYDVKGTATTIKYGGAEEVVADGWTVD